MLNNINLYTTMLKTEYKKLKESYCKELYSLQIDMMKAKIPMVIIVEGWGTSGKGKIISQIIEPLDPRYYKVYDTGNNCNETIPFLKEYIEKMPCRDKLSIFDRCWYKYAFWDNRTNTKKSTTDSINTIERQFSDDGCVIVKIFLHISQSEQKKRLQNIDKSFSANAHDHFRNKNYKEYFEIIDNAIENTNTEYAKWNIVSGYDIYSATISVYDIIVNSMKSALSKKDNEKNSISIDYNKTKNKFSLIKMTKLRDIDLSAKVDDDKYKEKLKSLQKTLSEQQQILFKKQISMVLVFEGWDAAGKGGSIKRVTSCLDPRDYVVIPISSPNTLEASHHYLWRFWKEIPQNGKIVVFDRSWYGRVMVERVEGFCEENRWKMAYNEINEFEHELTENGIIVVKFWLHISPEEQLTRFKERENTPEKRWKITDEDWRNRKKWSEYEIAVNEMLKTTSTSFAPWNIIECNNKKYGRLKILKTITKIIDEHIC